MGIISSAFFKLSLHISLGWSFASCGSGTKPTQEGSKPFEETWESLAKVNEEEVLTREKNIHYQFRKSYSLKD